jgi:hypothetical protein
MMCLHGTKEFSTEVRGKTIAEVRGQIAEVEVPALTMLGVAFTSAI